MRGASARTGWIVAGLGLLAAACSNEVWPPLPAPCASQPDERLCQVRTVDVDGVTRTFMVTHQTPNDCANGPLPVVLAWHGSGGNGEELRAILEVESALGGRMAFVYPDGLALDELGGATGWSRELAGDDVRFFDALLEQLAFDTCLDVSRVFSVGHSRGGRFVDTLGCVRGDRHRAMASIAAGSGNVDESLCDTQVPVWLSHGIHDEQVRPFEGDWLRDSWARRNGCEAVSWFDTFPINECTRLVGCDEETVFCPSDVRKWRGHFPPPFAGREIARFFEGAAPR